MKRNVLLYLFAGAFFAAQTSVTRATPNFYDNFDSYANGNLAGLTANAAGQGPWKETGATATTPVQVNNGTAVLGTSGQDVYAALTSPISITTGSTFYIGLLVNITAAKTTGDYFLHFTPTVGDTTALQERLFVKSSGAGFVFGYSGGNTAANYSSTVLSLNTAYTIVLAYTGVAGAANDTFSLYVNPIDTSIEGNNTPYMTSGYVGGTEASTVAGINLRQGTGSQAPNVIIDNLAVGTTFADALAVPEPSTIALAALGGFACLFALRRKH